MCEIGCCRCKSGHLLGSKGEWSLFGREPGAGRKSKEIWLKLEDLKPKILQGTQKRRARDVDGGVENKSQDRMRTSDQSWASRSPLFQVDSGGTVSIRPFEQA